MQWNFGLTEKWSVSGEPGLYDLPRQLRRRLPQRGPELRYAEPHERGACVLRRRRFHFNDIGRDHAASRLPDALVGVSFFPIS